jgi:hypothetical protein
MKSNASPLRGRVVAVAVVTAALLGGAVSFVTLGMGAGGATGTSNAAAATGSVYTPIAPLRIADTRLPSGVGNAGQTIHAGSSITVAMPNQVVPNNATAVVLNVTAVNATQATYFSVYPNGASNPHASNINVYPGITQPNLVVVPVGTDLSVDVFNFAGTADAVVDLEGYFTPFTNQTAGHFFPLTPNRITDTRAGTGAANQGNTLGAGSTLNVNVLGAGGVPATGVSAVELNVTATDTTAASYFTVYPRPTSGTAMPNASNLNWARGEVVANRVIVPVGLDGQVSIYNFAGSADAVVDVDGWFSNTSGSASTGSLFTPLNPARITDTRSGTGQPNAGKTIQPNSNLTVQVTGAGSIPSASTVDPVTAAVLNVTEATSTAAGFLTVYPTNQSKPNTSDVNFAAGYVIANADIAALSPTGQLNVYNFAGATDVAIDVFGYFTLASPSTINTVVITPVSPSTPASAADPVTLTATVTGPTGTGAGGAVVGDSVTFADSGGSSCGTLSAVSGSGDTAANGQVTGPTSATGHISVVYTPSNVAGQCTVEALEANTSASGTDVVTQTASSGYQISVTANPSSLPANGSSTSTVTATVTDNGTIAAGDNVTFTGQASVAGACSASFPGQAISTNSAGQSSFTYVASTTVGSCLITATEQNGPTASTVRINEATVGTVVTVSPATSSLAEGNNEPFTATVTSGGNPVVSDLVTFSVSSATCGELFETSDGQTTANNTVTAITDGSGVASGVSYTASDTSGACTVTATDTEGANGTATVTQSSTGPVVQVFAFPNVINADGTSTSRVVATVTNGGVSVGAGANVAFSDVAGTSGSCGSISSSPVKTNANGQATVTYTSSHVKGTCTITATDIGNTTGSAVILQEGSVASPTKVTLTPASSTAITVIGTTVQLTATVTGAGGAAIPGQELHLSMISSGVVGACGTLSETSGTTNANGQIMFTYTAPLVAPVLGTCQIVASDTDVAPAITGSASITELIPLPLGLGVPT